MSILFTRTAVVPVWLLVCVFAVVSSSPSGTVAIGPLILAQRAGRAGPPPAAQERRAGTGYPRNLEFVA